VYPPRTPPPSPRAIHHRYPAKSTTVTLHLNHRHPARSRRAQNPHHPPWEATKQSHQPHTIPVVGTITSGFRDYARNDSTKLPPPSPCGAQRLARAQTTQLFECGFWILRVASLRRMTRGKHTADGGGCHRYMGGGCHRYMGVGVTGVRGA